MRPCTAKDRSQQSGARLANCQNSIRQLSGDRTTGLRGRRKTSRHYLIAVPQQAGVWFSVYRLGSYVAAQQRVSAALALLSLAVLFEFRPAIELGITANHGAAIQSRNFAAQREPFFLPG